MTDKPELEYIDYPFDKELEKLIRRVPAQFIFEWDNEYGLDSKVLEKRWISNDCVRKLYPEYNSEIDDDKPIMLRIDYCNLLMPSSFRPWDPEYLTTREEHIIALESVIRDDALVGYGLGPELNHADWEDHGGTIFSSKHKNMTEEHYELLAETLSDSDYNYEIKEYLEDEGEIPENLHPLINEIYRKIAKKL